MHFVGDAVEHDAELPDDGAEARVVERQRLRVGGLECDVLAVAEFPPRDIEHRSVQVGRGQTRARVKRGALSMSRRLSPQRRTNG